jgi:fructose-1,6-bisphosphatase/inositol monophosphatase family enzyme
VAVFDESRLETLRGIVSQAGASEIMPRFRALAAADVTEKKSSIDLVTDADLLAEKRIGEALLKLYPEALIVGEEASESDPGLIGKLRDADLAFVIDPVDGTFNFAAGLPVFATILAVVVGGETVAGLIHDPVRGDTLMAARGAGARLVRADDGAVEARVAPAVSLDQAIGTISINDVDRTTRQRIGGNLGLTKMAFGYNCSAYEYWMAATGKVHFIGHFKLMPWDHLAGVLIHQEAGGHTARFDGSPYRPGETSGGILSAPDRAMWQDVLEKIVRA